MDYDSFTETTSESWFGRMGKSFGSVLIGILLFLVSFPLLFWNEGRAVQTARSLTEGQGALVKPALEKVDPANDGKLVYLSGSATSDETLTDKMLNVKEEKALRLVRKAEMYQWQEKSKSETRKKLGGGTEKTTTYTYEKVWSDKPIDSSGFKKSAEHQNPKDMPKSQDLVARQPRLGGYLLTDDLVRMITKLEPVELKEGQLPADAPATAKVVAGKVFVGQSPANPQIGDKRVSVSVVRSTPVSVIAGQGANGQLQPYQTKAGDPILMLEDGSVAAEQMFTKAQESNATESWILRAVGFFLMFIGLCMLATPLTTLLDVIPFLGDLAGVGVAIFAFPVAALLSLTTISIAWITYRPLLGIGLLAVGVGIFFLVKTMMGKKTA